MKELSTEFSHLSSALASALLYLSSNAFFIINPSFRIGTNPGAIRPGLFNEETSDLFPCGRHLHRWFPRNLGISRSPVTFPMPGKFRHASSPPPLFPLGFSLRTLARRQNIRSNFAEALVSRKVLRIYTIRETVVRTCELKILNKIELSVRLHPSWVLEREREGEERRMKQG